MSSVCLCFRTFFEGYLAKSLIWLTSNPVFEDRQVTNLGHRPWFMSNCRGRFSRRRSQTEQESLHKRRTRVIFSVTRISKKRSPTWWTDAIADLTAGTPILFATWFVVVLSRHYIAGGRCLRCPPKSGSDVLREHFSWRHGEYAALMFVNVLTVRCVTPVQHGLLL